MVSRATTLDDVARLAGVSYQTVSRVLNRPDQVAPATRERVTAAMQQLNYVPNRVAQQLAGKSTRTLGLATSDLALMAPAQIASAIQHRAAARGYHLVIAMAAASGAEAARATLNELLAQRVDGLLINLPLENSEALQLQGLCGEKPALFLDVADDAAVAQCQFSSAMGAQQGVAHLLALGHRRIALLNGPMHSISARQRFHAWEQALAAHQLRPHAVLSGDWSARSGYQAMMTLLPDNLPQALLVANDQMALGAMHALHQFGIAIPQQMSLMGYDDTAESAWYQPPLTTVRQDLRLLGEVSVDRLLARLHAETDTTPALETSLVLRATTAPPSQGKPDRQALVRQLQVLARQLGECE
ncbi:LacI family DNA-binding transcriptional regulator [[Erwinia] mediterraneensis]|uniref:LacI family DNA-binding transcriptional regulator n=1 Tax=[Erwinia] mediterraneensis TaxID=2161819 RepID=UPI001031536D|nr:LacI family DNA-binding transcriptional regulator [[Erwinia] mediterraneensis]